MRICIVPMIVAIWVVAVKGRKSKEKPKYRVRRHVMSTMIDCVVSLFCFFVLFYCFLACMAEHLAIGVFMGGGVCTEAIFPASVMSNPVP